MSGKMKSRRMTSGSNSSAFSTRWSGASCARWYEVVRCSSKDTTTTSFPLYTQDEATVERLVQEGGLVAPTGKPGSMLMFDGNLVHGSSGNITPFPRKIVYLTLCAVSNHITRFNREEWIAHRDFTPIEPVADDALLEYARKYKVAAE